MMKFHHFHDQFLSHIYFYLYHYTENLFSDISFYTYDLFLAIFFPSPIQKKCLKVHPFSKACSKTHCSFHPSIILLFRRGNEYNTFAAIETESRQYEIDEHSSLSSLHPSKSKEKRIDTILSSGKGKEKRIYLFVFQESARWTEMRKSLNGSHRQWSGGKAPWRIKRPITMGTFINGITRCRRASEIRGRNIIYRIGRISFWRGCSPC